MHKFLNMGLATQICNFAHLFEESVLSKPFYCVLTKNPDGAEIYINPNRVAHFSASKRDSMNTIITFENGHTVEVKEGLNK